MLNYVSAELYKLSRKKGLWLGLGLFLLLESALFLPDVLFFGTVDNEIDAYYCFFVSALCVGLFVPPAFAVQVYDGQQTCGTLKNEIVFGIPRSRIYLGKLLAAAVTGTAAAAAAAGLYFFLTWTKCAGIPDELIRRETLLALGVSWLTWLAILSLTFFLLFLLRNPAMAVVMVYFLVLVSLPLSVIGAGEPGSPLWLKILCRNLFTYPYGMRLFSVALAVQGGGCYELGRELTVCLMWNVVPTALGLALFHRKEIK